MLIDWYHKFNPEEGRISPIITSLPRDCLQAERSLLQYVKFSGTLGFASIAILLNFKFVYDEKMKGLVFQESIPITRNKLTIATSCIFFFLSLGALFLGISNYFINVSNFMEGHTRTGSFRTGINFFVLLVVVCLIAINVTLLIDSNHWVPTKN